MSVVLLQIDDPLDAIAVHAFNGTWGVWAVGLFGAKNLINTSYGSNPYTMGSRHYGCFMGGGGNLLAAQIVYSIWLGGKHPLHSLIKYSSYPVHGTNAAFWL